MMQLGTITSPSGLDIPRDGKGRPLIVPADGGKPIAYTRASKFGDALEDEYNLTRWKLRMAISGMTLADHLPLAVAAHRDDKNALNRLAEEAMTAAQAGGQASKGTALHKLAEKVDRGEALGPIPAEYRADIDAYQRTTEGIEWTHLERFVVCDALRAAGTADRFGIYRGRLVVGDMKTGSVDYPLKMAVQLAIYANAKGYHPDSGRFDLGDIDLNTGLIVHLPQGQGRCDLYEIDLAAGWQAAKLAEQVRAIRAESRKWTRPAKALDALADQIATAEDGDVLAEIWRANRDLWTPAHSELAAARKALLAGGAA